MDNVLSRNPRLQWLDIMKGIGIILVATGHIFENDFAFNYIYSFHMPLFFFASGWVYRKKDIIGDIKNRFITIMIPFYSFGVLEIIYFHLIEARVRDMTVPLKESVTGLLLVYHDYLDFNVHLWFLPCIFLMGILFNILVHIGGKKMAYVVAGVLAAVSVVIDIPYLVFELQRICSSLIYFALGTLLADMKADEFIEKKPLLVRIAAIAIMGTAGMVLAYFGLIDSFMSVVAAVVGIILCTVISITIKSCKLLEQIGQRSLFILCVHGPLYRVIVGALSKLSGISSDTLRQNFVPAMIIVALTVMICRFVYPLFAKFVPWMIGKKFVKQNKTA